MNIFELLLALFLISLFVLLLIYFFYTIYAVFRGAIFLPTPRKAVRAMIDVSKPTAGMTVMDLGSGDGRILLALSPSGARCIGVEINILLVWVSRIKAFLLGRKNIEIWCKDFWNIDLSDIDLLCVWLVPIKMEALKKKIQSEMKAGSKVVSYRNPLPEWPHDECKDKVYLYSIKV